MQTHSTDKDLSSISCAAKALRLLTQDRHRALEALPIFRRLMLAEVTHEDYRVILKMHYRFYAVLEPTLLANEALGLPYQPRLPLLERDLAALGCPLPKKTGHALMLPTKAAACGCRYVIEGSALGGHFISAHLRERLGDVIGSALAFYTLDDQPLVSWPKVQEALSVKLDSQQAINEAAACANLVFSLLEQLANY
jgi:Heme oxygenase